MGGDERIILKHKVKNIGGDERTILKNKIKSRKKNRLTNKKPTLDIKSQYRILIL